MYREPLFMEELHRRQSKEYERCKKLNLHQFMEYINTKAAMIGQRSEDRGQKDSRFRGNDRVGDKVGKMVSDSVKNKMIEI